MESESHRILNGSDQWILCHTIVQIQNALSVARHYHVSTRTDCIQPSTRRLNLAILANEWQSRKPRSQEAMLPEVDTQGMPMEGPKRPSKSLNGIATNIGHIFLGSGNLLLTKG